VAFLAPRIASWTNPYAINPSLANSELSFIVSRYYWQENQEKDVDKQQSTK